MPQQLAGRNLEIRNCEMQPDAGLGRTLRMVLPERHSSRCRERAARVQLPVGTADDRHQLRYLLPLIRLVAACDRVLDAMRDVIPQDFFLDAAERGPHRRDLGDDIDAIAILIHHFGQAADLALDPAQTLLTGCLDVFSHAAYIPP